METDQNHPQTPCPVRCFLPSPKGNTGVWALGPAGGWAVRCQEPHRGRVSGTQSGSVSRIRRQAGPEGQASPLGLQAHGKCSVYRLLSGWRWQDALLGSPGPAEGVQ